MRKIFNLILAGFMGLLCLGFSACGGAQSYRSIYAYSFFGNNKLEIPLRIKKAYQDPVCSSFTRSESLEDFLEIIMGMETDKIKYRCSLYGINDEEYLYKYLFIEKLVDGNDYYYLLVDRSLEEKPIQKYLLFDLSAFLFMKGGGGSMWILFPYFLFPSPLWIQNLWNDSFYSGTDYDFPGSFTALKDFYVNCGGYDVTDYGTTLELAEKNPDPDHESIYIRIVYDETTRSVRFELKRTE